MWNRLVLIDADAMGGSIGTRQAETAANFTVSNPCPAKRQGLLEKGGGFRHDRGGNRRRLRQS